MLDDGTTFQQTLFVSIPFKYLLIDATGKYIGQIGFQLRKLSCTVKEIHPPVIIKQKRTVMEMRGARKKFPGTGRICRSIDKPASGRAIGFRLREGVAIGAKVTLRGERMYEFLDKLVSVSLPRVRDFHGVPTKSFDGRGNYTLGVKEQLIFPEINFDDVDKVRGMDIVIVTTANTDEEGRELLKGLGMPFAK